MSGIPPFPSGFRTRAIPTNGTSLHVRTGGQGPAAVLLHGYGETGDMWALLAAELARDHSVIAPDLRGCARLAATSHIPSPPATRAGLRAPQRRT